MADVLADKVVRVLANEVVDVLADEIVDVLAANEVVAFDVRILTVAATVLLLTAATNGTKQNIICDLALMRK